MSSDSDRVVFDECVEPQDNTVLFQKKAWTYITDSSSAGGVFNGQLQFDLNTLSSQNQWTDLSQAYIQFPVKLTINSATAVGTAAAQNFDTFSATIANGFHQFVDSTQITIGGTTIQSSQIHENINATFKMLTEFSQDELHKNGPTLGFALDDYQIASDSSPSTYNGLDNIPISALSAPYAGVQYPFNRNTGFKTRSLHLNSDVLSGGTCVSILGTNAASIGKGRVQAVNGSATIAANSDVFVAFYMATIRLKDISDAIAKLPCVKGLKGFIYVNYNAARVSFTSTASTGSVKTAAPSAQALYGRTMPAMLNTAAAGSSDLSLTFTAEISGVPSTTLSSASPAFNNARLFAPYFVANPDVDRALTMTKTIRYHERFVTTFNIAANGSYAGTLSPGISNPKRVILLPLLTGTNAATAGLGAFSSNPLLSPWDPAGKGASSPFAALSNLQITVGGVPMWQAPVNMDYEAFVQEVSQIGLDGGLVVQTNSGLLNQRLWNQMYRYYTCDVSRRMTSEDGASKSVLVSCNNPTNAPMTVIAHIWYEKEIKVDTAMGTISQGL